MNRTLTGLIALGVLQSVASAGLSASFEWRQVDNTMFGPELDPINGAAWVVNN